MLLGGADRLRVEHEQSYAPVRVDQGAEDDADDQRIHLGHPASFLSVSGFTYLDYMDINPNGGIVGRISACSNGKSREIEVD